MADFTLEALRKFLAGFGETCLATDAARDVPGAASLYGRGEEELWRRRDICGGEAVRVKRRFAVYKAFAQGGGHSDEGAAWAEGLERFVAGEQAAGRAPRFGDVSREGEVLRALGGKRHSTPSPGVALYEVLLEAEYTRVALP